MPSSSVQTIIFKELLYYNNGTIDVKPPLTVDPKSPLPIYAQLERAIRQAVVAGILKVGDQLPTVRQLAVDLSINANTVAKVYASLERDGLLETHRGVGTFVVRTLPALSRRDHLKRLEEFVAKTLSEAQREGFTLEELIEYFKSIQRR
jgi:GntR family transcriptional regulator